jgi:hypothetical protein
MYFTGLDFSEDTLFHWCHAWTSQYLSIYLVMLSQTHLVHLGLMLSMRYLELMKMKTFKTPTTFLASTPRIWESWDRWWKGSKIKTSELQHIHSWF